VDDRDRPLLAYHTACLGPNPQKFESIEEFNPLLTFLKNYAWSCSRDRRRFDRSVLF